MFNGQPQYGVASTSTATALVHQEDLQPNEGINKRKQMAPPLVKADAPPHVSRFGGWMARGRGGSSRGGWQGNQNGARMQYTVRGQKSWRGKSSDRGGSRTPGDHHQQSPNWNARGSFRGRVQPPPSWLRRKPSVELQDITPTMGDSATRPVPDSEPSSTGKPSFPILPAPASFRRKPDMYGRESRTLVETFNAIHHSSAARPRMQPKAKFNPVNPTKRSAPSVSQSSDLPSSSSQPPPSAISSEASSISIMVPAPHRPKMSLFSTPSFQSSPPQSSSLPSLPTSKSAERDSSPSSRKRQKLAHNSYTMAHQSDNDVEMYNPSASHVDPEKKWRRSSPRPGIPPVASGSHLRSTPESQVASASRFPLPASTTDSPALPSAFPSSQYTSTPLLQPPMQPSTSQSLYPHAFPPSFRYVSHTSSRYSTPTSELDQVEASLLPIHTHASVVRKRDRVKQEEEEEEEEEELEHPVASSSWVSTSHSVKREPPLSPTQIKHEPEPHPSPMQIKPEPHPSPMQIKPEPHPSPTQIKPEPHPSPKQIKPEPLPPTQPAIPVSPPPPSLQHHQQSTNSPAPPIQMQIKPEPASPSPPQAPERRLVTESCSFFPMRDECRKKSNPRWWQDARRQYFREEYQKLRARGVKKKKVFFRDDGMVIEWTSVIPLWSDTLLPDEASDLASTIVQAHTANSSSPRRRRSSTPERASRRRRNSNASRTRGGRSERSESTDHAHRRPGSSHGISSRLSQSHTAAEVINVDALSESDSEARSDCSEVSVPLRSLKVLSKVLEPPPAQPPARPPPSRGALALPRRARPLPAKAPELAREVTVSAARGSGPDTEHSASRGSDESLREKGGPGLTVPVEGSSREGANNLDDGSVWSADDASEAEGLAIQFLQRYIQAFDSDRSTLEYAYSRNAIFSYSIHQPRDASFSRAGLFAPPDVSSHGRMSTLHFGRSQIIDKLCLFRDYKFCPRGAPANVHYDVAALLEDRILLTLHGEVSNPFNPGGKKEIDHTVSLDQSFVLMRSGGAGNGGGMGGDEDPWPLVVVSHQMTVRDAPLLSPSKLERISWMKDIL